ncbi:MAG: GNAT family N-acetyltransferase [Candidatus Promineifilaceae bacterium]|jgi:GNAT superfamily N-acetyltransferase
MNRGSYLSDETWKVIANPADEDINKLGRNLHSYNLSTVGPDEEATDLAIFIRERNGEMVAGGSGVLWGAVFELEKLWVDDSHQGKGIGSRLLKALEREVYQRGCTIIHTNTFSFQAPEFYQKQGYEPFGRVPGYGSKGAFEKVFLRKELT